jgi:hypothetical protein
MLQSQIDMGSVPLLLVSCPEDVGSNPFSHIFDYFFPAIDLANPDKLKYLTNYCRSMTATFGSPVGYRSIFASMHSDAGSNPALLTFHF